VAVPSLRRRQPRRASMRHLRGGGTARRASACSSANGQAQRHPHRLPTSTAKPDPSGTAGRTISRRDSARTNRRARDLCRWLRDSTATRRMPHLLRPAPTPSLEPRAARTARTATDSMGPSLAPLSSLFHEMGDCPLLPLSSGHRWGGDLRRGVGGESLKDDIGQVALKYAERFPAALARLS